MKSSELLQIGEAVERVDLSLRTVRYWEEVGLVEPEARSKGGFRLYSAADLDRLLVIKAMKPLGLTLEEMRELLELIDAAKAGPPDSNVLQRIEESAQLVQNRVDRMERDLREARVLLTELSRWRRTDGIPNPSTTSFQRS